MGPVLCGVAVYLGLRTFVFPATPVLLGGDQAFFWMYAERMLRGEHVYRDFFQFTPPGTDLVYLAAFELLGPRVWVTNAVVVALGVAIAAACFRVGGRLMDDGLAALATAAFVVMVYGQSLSGTHHWFSVLAVLCAVAVVASGTSGRRFAAAGILLGTASFFTQTHGAASLVGFVAFTAWDGHFRRLAARRRLAHVALLLGAFGLTLLVLGGYLLLHVGPANLWSLLVSYTWQRMAASLPGPDLGLPEPVTLGALHWLAPYLLVYGIVPVGYALTAGSLWRASVEADAERRRTAALTWFVGVALLLEVAMGLSWVRLFAVSMPAILLLVHAFGRAGRWRGPLIGASWLAVAALAGAFVRSTRRHHTLVIDLPAGRVATDTLQGAKLLWLSARIPPGGALFAADRPSIYLPLGLRNPLFLDAAVPTTQTRLEDVRRAIAELEEHRLRYVVWSPSLEDADGTMEGIVALRAYIHDRYHRVQAFADGDEAWERD